MRVALGYRASGLCGMFCAASLLAGCGGSSGSDPAPFSPSAAPGITGSSGAPSAVYAQTATYDGAPLAGLICQSPAYPVGTAHTWPGTISQSVATNQSYNGQSGLIAVTSYITLQGCAATAFDTGSEPVSETDYFAQLAGNGNGVSETVLVGATMQWTDILGNSQMVDAAYSGGGLIVNEVPFQSGRTWSSAATRTISRNSGQNSQEKLVVNSDGSYNDASVQTGGTVYPYDSITRVENSDASGSRTEVTQVQGASTPSPPYGLTLSAPSNNTVVVTPFGTAPVDPVLPTPAPGATPAPAATPYSQYAWYPYVPTVAHPLETITSIDKGAAALPKSCNTSSTFPKSAELIETVDATLDIWSGTTTSTTDAYIDAKAGVLCVNVNVQQAMYALGATSADTTPTGTSTLTFTDALQSETAPPAVFAVPALARYLRLWR